MTDDATNASAGASRDVSPDGSPETSSADDQESSPGEDTGPSPDDDRPTLPEDVVDDAETLTREARALDDEQATALIDERDELLEEYDFRARVRSDDDGAVLVCYPQSWVVDGDVVPSEVEDPDVAVERRIAGAASPDEWASVDEANRAVVEAIDEAVGDPYATVAAVLADFAGNHYAKPIADLSAAACEEFATEYSRRNAWLSSDERAAIPDTIALAFAVEGRACPIDATPPSGDGVPAVDDLEV